MNERIVCAANKDQWGYVVLGVRHHCPLMNENIKSVKVAYFSVTTPDFKDQGFITNRGRYVSREEAWLIAKAENQIIRRCGGDEYSNENGELVGRLFSENLY